MRCSYCHRPIRTRTIYSVARISDAEIAVGNFCTLCFETFVPRRNQRLLNRTLDISLPLDQDPTQTVLPIT